MKSIVKRILLVLLLIAIIIPNTVYAYWGQEIIISTEQVSITIGAWREQETEEFDSSKVYYEGDEVIYNGIRYRARRDVLFRIPPEGLFGWIFWTRV